MLNMMATQDYLGLEADEARTYGRSLADQYQTAEPFPHIVIDDFLPQDILRKVLDDFPSSANKEYFDRGQERLKYQYQPQDISSGLIRNLFAELNGQAFLGFLEELTGIKGLIPDPYFEGGGLHETKRGGHLGVHADFNVHERLRLERRLNLLIYLNEDWADDYGGQLELWNKDMSDCAVRVKPVFGRAVIFNTALDSFHGHPDPLGLPGRPLTSIDRYLLLHCGRGGHRASAQAHDQLPLASGERRPARLADPAVPFRQRLDAAQAPAARSPAVRLTAIPDQSNRRDC